MSSWAWWNFHLFILTKQLFQGPRRASRFKVHLHSLFYSYKVFHDVLCNITALTRLGGETALRTIWRDTARLYYYKWRPIAACGRVIAHQEWLYLSGAKDNNGRETADDVRAEGSTGQRYNNGGKGERWMNEGGDREWNNMKGNELKRSGPSIHRPVLLPRPLAVGALSGRCRSWKQSWRSIRAEINMGGECEGQPRAQTPCVPQMEGRTNRGVFFHHMSSSE